MKQIFRKHYEALRTHINFKQKAFKIAMPFLKVDI